MQDFIPSRDAQARDFMIAFATLILADPGRYQLTQADAQAIMAAVQDFADALAVTASGPTRNAGTIAQKDIKRVNAEQILRQYATDIKYNAGVSVQDKVDLGIRPPNPARTPIDPPSTSPLVNIIGATPGAQTLRFSDTNTPDKRGKPPGAVALQLFVTIAEAPATDPTQAQFVGAYTKNPIGVGFTPADNGKIATYFARWANAKGEAGPWSIAVSMAVAA